MTLEAPPTSGPMRLAELLGGLMLAADIVNGFPPEKVLRTAVLAVRLGERAGLGAAALRDAYYLTIFRFLGCTGFAHEEGAAFGAGDDITTRNVMALADPTELGQTLGGIVSRVGQGAPLLERAKAVARLLHPDAVLSHAHAQCDMSVRLAQLVGMSDGVVQALAQVCERHDGRGVPAGADGSALSSASKLLHLADAAEIALHRSGVEVALALVQRRSGRQLDPALCALFAREGRELLAELATGSIWQAFLDAEPSAHALAQGSEQANVALAFARFVDMKSVFTLEHSAQVARLATRAGELAGLDRERTAQLGLAAHLHDLGRVSVPNRIWDKPAALDVSEWERVRLHAYYTERILARGPSWASAAKLATGAHERLDASGYHRSLPAAALGLPERLLAASDVFGALLADRPQRPAFSPEQARDLLRAEVRAKRLSSDAVDAVIAAHAGTAARPPRAWPSGLSDREVEVLRLVAIGKSNSEAGVVLGISPKTVKNHVANLYAKIGVYSRAGAALFAAEHELL